MDRERIWYKMTFIYADYTEDYKDFTSTSLTVTHNVAISKMKKKLTILSTLIYSNEGSAKIIKNKEAYEKNHSRKETSLCN